MTLPPGAPVTPSPGEAARQVWGEAGGDPAEIAGLRLTGEDPVLPSVFRVGTAAAACVGVTTVAAAALWRMRGGSPGAVQADVRAAALAFRSERYLRVDGEPPGDLWAPLSGDYPAGDGRWVRLHGNFPHHRDAVSVALGVPADRAAVTGAVAMRRALDVERAVEQAGGCAATMRSQRRWRRHPQARAIRDLPLVEITPLGQAGPPTLPPAPARPLSGVRVLDLTRVIAGPVCGRVLAAHGADVLHVGAAHLPTVPPLVIDTGFGKRSCHLDLRRPEGRERLRMLVGGADVLVQSYRPGALVAAGFGPAELARLRPGLVYVDVSAYGRRGPWRARRGFDSLVQMACGIAEEGMRGARSAAPLPLPAQVLDHASGWLAAFGVLTALRRRLEAGGSWHVAVSLARTAAWLDGLGRVAGGLRAPDPALGAVGDVLETMATPFGSVTFVRPPGGLPGAQPRWERPPPRPGSDRPRWES